MSSPLQFNYIPYPLWRKTVPPLLRPLTEQFYRRIYPVDLDDTPPTTYDAIARYLVRWGVMNITDIRGLETIQPQRLKRICETPRTTVDKIRLPAQWERMHAVIVHFPVIYPPLWTLYAQMVEAISKVADVQITTPGGLWAEAILLYLKQRGIAQLDRLYFLEIAADDIWVRDYGPFVGLYPDGSRGVVTATYATHPNYPQAGDDMMPTHFAAYHDLPLRTIPLKTEGGNFLTDGEGTLIMTQAVLDNNPAFTRESLEALLHEYFDFEKLILTPRLSFETTGHVDMMVKLIDRKTVLLSASHSLTAQTQLKALFDLFHHETNAHGEHYHIETVPTLPLYYNWFFYPIRRSYTNTLTVNGLMLVPVYGVHEDASVLATYRRIAPDATIIPIDCKVGANGGGAVHCMTKEVAAVQNDP